MTVETRETNGPFDDIFQTKNTVTSVLSDEELEEWYKENGDWTLPVIGQETHAEAGSIDVQMLPLSCVIELMQIRQTYDADELEELADRMPVEIVDGVPHITLVNPPTINVFDRKDLAIKYLNDMYNYHRGEMEPIDIDSLHTHDGKYRFYVNGHRRSRALKLKCLQLGIRPENLQTSFKVEHNMPFGKAKTQQYVENTSVPINPVDDAHAIELHYLWLRDEGEDYSVTALQKVFGYKPGKIYDALRFVTAPEEITKFVGKGITYTNVVELVKLREAYAESLKRKYVYNQEYDALEGVSDESERNMMDYFEARIVNRLRGKTTAHLSEKIRAQTKLIKGQSDFTTDSLFIYDEEAERRNARVKVRRDIAGAAIEALAYLDAQGDLGPEDIAALRALLDAKLAASVVDLKLQTTEMVPDEEGDSLFIEEIA